MCLKTIRVKKKTNVETWVIVFSILYVFLPSSSPHFYGRKMTTWDRLMTASNSRMEQSVSFYLTGIPGYENANHLSILFCMCYLVGIVGNSAILHIIYIDKSLHKPMYYFLAMLSLTDMGMSISTLPTVLKNHLVW